MNHINQPLKNILAIFFIVTGGIAKSISNQQSYIGGPKI
jgi:hypothetical protein